MIQSICKLMEFS